MKLKCAFLLLLIVVVLNFTKTSSAQPNSLTLEGLVGKVKRIDEETSEMKLKKGVLKEGSRVRSRTIIFDKDGRMTYRWWKIKVITSATETYYSYEKDNKRLQRTQVIDPFADSSKKPSERFSQHVFRYDASENALYEDVYIGKQPDFDILTQKYKYIFGTDNRLLERVDFTTRGVAMSSDKYIYGMERLPIERDLIVKGNPLQQTLKYTYTLDAQGNWIKRITENTPAIKDAAPSIEVEYRKISYYQ